MDHFSVLVNPDVESSSVEYIIDNLETTQNIPWENEDLQVNLAVMRSLTSKNEKTRTINEVLQEMKSNITDAHVSVFNIYREDVFECCVRSLKRKSFCPFNKIAVSGIGNISKGAIDAVPKADNFFIFF